MLAQHATTTPTPPRLNRRDQAKAATRAKVLAAAKHLFETVGYAPATIRGIAEAAGMSTGAIFASFKDKAALYCAVYGHAPETPEGGRRLVKALKLALLEIETEIEQRQTGGNSEDWLQLQSVWDQGVQAITLATKVGPATEAQR